MDYEHEGRVPKLRALIGAPETNSIADVIDAATEYIERLHRERDEAYTVCEKLADWWHKHGIEATKEIDEIAWQARGVVFKVKGPEKP